MTEQAEQTDSELIVTDAIGTNLRGLFEQAEIERRPYEDQWLKDLRQYKGQYEPEVEKDMDPNRSKAFVRLTRTKVRTMDARALELLFPNAGDKNWSIGPTPKPDIPVERKVEVGKELAEQSEDGLAPEEEEVDQAISDMVKKAAKEMESTMDDQLGEADYEEVCRKVVHQGHLLGTGILKGPLVQTKDRKSWKKGEGGFSLNEVQERRPYFEKTDLWNYYPDLSSGTLKNADFEFERHIMNKSDMRGLARREDFDAARIREYLAAHPNGDIKFKYHETELKNINKNLDTVLDRRNKYEVLEYWGYMDGRSLLDCGCEIPEGEIDVEFEANVWIVGSLVIKAELNPTEQKARPYHFYLFEEDETGPFGVSIPSIMSDTQTLFNAAIRLMVDNAAISAGPQIEIDVSMLHESEIATARDVFPFKVRLTDTTGKPNNAKAVHVSDLPSYTPEFMKLAELFKNLGDEASTIPSYLHGENDKGVGRTVGGLSMLMGAANITIKDVVKSFDDGITEPAIEALYHWNMQFNPKEEIKGDYQVKARGSSSLVAKELQAKSLNEFSSTLADDDMPYVDRGKLIRHKGRVMDLPEGIVRSEDDADEFMFMRQQIEEMGAMIQQLQSQLGLVEQNV